MVNSFLFAPAPVKRRATKAEITDTVRLLTESSVSLAGSDLVLAKAQSALARRLMLRFNIRLGPSVRRFTCRGCKSLLVPGVNARVRLGHGKLRILRITCTECGHVNRKTLASP
jgi:RNase P subunit RPR2